MVSIGTGWPRHNKEGFLRIFGVMLASAYRDDASIILSSKQLDRATMDNWDKKGKCNIWEDSKIIQWLGIQDTQPC